MVGYYLVFLVVEALTDDISRRVERLAAAVNEMGRMYEAWFQEIKDRLDRIEDLMEKVEVELDALIKTDKQYD